MAGIDGSNQGGIAGKDAVPGLVEIQVKVPSMGYVIPALQKTGRIESEKHAKIRAKNGSGEKNLVFKDTMSTGLVGILYGLETAGYDLVFAIAEARRHKRGNKSYYVQRFVFASPSDIVDERLAEELLRNRDLVMEQLRAVIVGTRGRTRAFSNPYFDSESKEEIEGKWTMLINYDMLQAITQNGKPIMVWKYKGGKKKTGNEKIPMAPETNLWFDGRIIIAS